jgi:hypothetical protein
MIGARFAANGEPEVSLAAAIMVSKWWTLHGTRDHPANPAPPVHQSKIYGK